MRGVRPEIDKIMENKAKEQSGRRHHEVCFVRNLESLHEDDLRLVLRDKIAPVSGGDALSQVRVAHSDEALAVMFSLMADEHQAVGFACSIKAEEADFEVGCDGHIYIKGVDATAVEYFSRYDNGKRWYVVVVELRRAGLANNAKAVELDIILPHTAEQESATLHLVADLV